MFQYCYSLERYMYDLSITLRGPFLKRRKTGCKCKHENQAKLRFSKGVVLVGTKYTPIPNHLKNGE